MQNEENPNESELSQVHAIIEAAREDSWEKFVGLSAEPFRNASSMREQFDDSVMVIRTARNLTFDITASRDTDGSRLLFVKVILDPGTKPITLIMHRAASRSDGLLAIWTFFQEVEFS